jgi:tetratricopeptide (TPR) repeat protein
MTPLRVVGLMVLVFVVSLPAAFLMREGSPDWLKWDSKELGEDREERDDPVVDLLCIQALKELSDGNNAKAIATYTKAIERDPKYAFAYIGRGDAFALQGDIDRAIQDYNQAARLDPSNPTARERLVLARMEKAAK